MTAVIADETLNLNEETQISNFAVSTYGRQGKLLVGETYTIEELLYPLLLESSNDAAEAIAEHKDRKRFIASMNGKAEALNLKSTYFDDPSGLSDNNVSTSEDLFKLIQYINKYRSHIFDITKLKQYEARDTLWFSNSKFRGEENYLGGKNGYTDEAGRTLISIWNLKLGDEYRKIAIILLDNGDYEKDTREIINYLNKNIIYQ
jgi:D-alanyl-D-alanine carboxypeptidase